MFVSDELQVAVGKYKAASELNPEHQTLEPAPTQHRSWGWGPGNLSIFDWLLGTGTRTRHAAHGACVYIKVAKWRTEVQIAKYKQREKCVKQRRFNTSILFAKWIVL